MRMTKNIFVIAALCSIALSGCTAPTTSTVAQEHTPIKIGVIAPLSGPAATIGEDAVHAYTLAIEKFNTSQSKYTAELVIEDGKCNGKDATSAAQKLVNIDNVKVIIWGVCSSETLAAIEVTQPAHVVLLSPASSSPEISKAKDFVYRFYNDLTQSEVLANYLSKSNLNKIAIIAENTDYAVGLKNALKQRLDPQAAVIEQDFNTEEKDLGIIAKNIAAKKDSIQAIVYIPNSDTNSINIVKALDAEWLTTDFKWKILTSEASISAAFFESLGTASEGILSTQLPAITQLWSEAESFVKEFKTKYTPNYSETFLVLFYEAVKVVTDGVADPEYGAEKLNEYIRNISKDHPRAWVWGEYYFEGADARGLSFVVKQVHNGALVDIAQ